MNKHNIYYVLSQHNNFAIRLHHSLKILHASSHIIILFVYRITSKQDVFMKPQLMPFANSCRLNRRGYYYTYCFQLSKKDESRSIVPQDNRTIRLCCRLWSKTIKPN